MVRIIMLNIELIQEKVGIIQKMLEKYIQMDTLKAVGLDSYLEKLFQAENQEGDFDKYYI